MHNPTERLTRIRKDAVIGGVATGLGRYFHIDPVIVRLAFVLLVFLNGVGLLAYVVLWLIMPSDAKAKAPAVTDTKADTAADSGIREVLVASGATRRPRFDPMTGEPIGDAEEIPIENLGTGEESSTDPQLQRSWILGGVLVLLGAVILLQTFVPAIAPFVIPVALIGAGIYFIARTRSI